MQRVVGVVDGGPDGVRAVEAFTAPAEVVLEVVIKLERLPALQCHRVVEPPAIL